MSEPRPPNPSAERGRRFGGEGQLDQRRFHAFGVGLAKTGTNSLAESFASYRSGSEFMFQEAIEAFARFADGADDQAEFRAFLRRRDALGGLEMDSASFHHFYVEELISEFPEARFIHTVRDAVSWTESFLQMMLRNRARYVSAPYPAWQATLGRLMVGSFDPDVFVSRTRLEQALPEIVGGYFAYWARSNRLLLRVLPAERSIRADTLELSTTLPNVARFLGVPPERLRPEGFHANAGGYDVPLLSTLDPKELARLVDRECGDVNRDLFGA